MGKIAKAARTEADEVATKAEAIGVPPEQIERGFYGEIDVKLEDGEKVTTYRTLINRGGTPIARWKRERQFSDSQWQAIEHCQTLWMRAGTVRGLVSDHLRLVGTGSTSGLSQQDALDELSKYRNRVPPKYWDIFENVVRWDEPAGMAGSKLANNSRSAKDAAKTCVCFVADLVAMWRGF